ncbi:MAG: hypothetical protein ACFCUR_12450 [Rhodomicrobiaceae bacterium]
MNTIVTTALGVAAIGLVAAVGMALWNVPESGNGIVETSKYESSDNSTVLTFEFPPTEDVENIHQHAKNLSINSSGNTEIYYFYRGVKVPAEDVANADSIDAVKNVLFKDPAFDRWRYAFLKASDGSEQLVDCQMQPVKELCRQEVLEIPVQSSPD